MSFFFAELGAEASKRAPAAKKPRLSDIPVMSLRQLGCAVCPRGEDSTLRSPKMRPSGPTDAPVYLLGAAPTEEDDENDNHWTDKAGDAIYKAFGNDFMRASVRSNYVTQCRGDQTQVEVECCRNRIVADIERVRPLVIVTVGDPPLSWAGISGTAMVNRGELFATRIGNHVCWVYSLMYPAFVFKKSYGRSEYELALQHDVRKLKGMLAGLPQPRVHDAPYDGGIQLITGQEGGDLQRLEDALNKLARRPRSAVDIEATGLRPYMLRDPLILTAAVGTFDHTVSFPVWHPDGWGSTRYMQKAHGLLGEYLMQSGRKVCHNLAMELEWFEHDFGRELLRRTEWDDTMSMAHTLDERPGTKSLGYQTRKHFGFDLKAQSPINVRQENWWLLYSLKDILRYNGMDTKWTDRLRDILAPLVAAENQPEHDRKVRLAATLVLTETVGLDVDFEYMMDQEDKFRGALKDINQRVRQCDEVRLYERRHGPFDPGNPHHVMKLMKDVLGRDEVRVEERGAVRWTTDEEALGKIPPEEVPSAALVLEHRATDKMLGTYIGPVLERKIVCRDGRIRCKYSSMTAVTGRLASENPNFQNWPKRKNKEVRGAIIPPEGYWLCPVDYGQIEFRVIGMASGDDNLVKYVWTDYDVHGDWAERIVRRYGKTKDWIVREFGVDWDEKGHKTLRQEMKNRWVFPQFFGSSFKSCAVALHLPEDIAKNMSAELWDEFPGVKAWQEDQLAFYEKHLYVQTLSGRKRRGPMTKNEIINLPIQGTAFDIVAESMNVLSERADAEDDPELQPVINVHDDLTFCIRDDHLSTKLPIIAHEMCKPRFDYINVPLMVEISAGKRWHDVQEITKMRSDVLFNIPNPYKEKTNVRMHA